METLVASLGENLAQLNILNTAYKLNGDLRALALVYSAELPVVPPPDLAPVLNKLLDKIKQETGKDFRLQKKNKIDSRRRKLQ